jgi:hypothetical protein
VRGKLPLDAEDGLAGCSRRFLKAVEPYGLRLLKGREAGDKARAIPELTVRVAFYGPCYGECFAVIAGIDVFSANEMPVRAETIDPVLGHIRPHERGKSVRYIPKDSQRKSYALSQF